MHIRLNWRVFSRWAILAVLTVFTLSLGACSSCGFLDESGAPAESTSDNWIAVYFTAPVYPDDESNRPTGIDADLVALIENAQESVDVAAYELNLYSVADALVAASERGVAVRVVIDETNADEQALDVLLDADIPITARPDTGRGIMHNKFVVVDGAWTWTGSWNLTENCTYRNNNNAVLIASRTLAQDYAVEFEELFAGDFGPSSPADTPNPRVTIQTPDRSVRVEVYFAPEDDVADHLIDLLDTAQSNVRFMAFSFTSSRIADKLIELAERGVTVQGVFEARSSGDQYSQFDTLQAAGIDVWPDGNPYVMHHKVFIVDDQAVAFGSYNFSNNADEYNDENLLIIHDPDVAADYLGEFGRVLQQAETASP